MCLLEPDWSILPSLSIVLSNKWPALLNCELYGANDEITELVGRMVPYHCGEQIVLILHLLIDLQRYL